jgi:hypothetical protein
MKWTSGTLLEMSGYYWKTCTLHAGVSLDIFTLIGSDCVSAETHCNHRFSLLFLLK